MPGGTTVVPVPSAAAHEGAVLDGAAAVGALAVAEAPELLAELDELAEEQPVTASSEAAEQASSMEPTPACARFTFANMYHSECF